LPDGDADYSGRWRMIKASFVRELRRTGVEIATNTKGECDVWQRRFWEHRIGDGDDLARHVDYIHINPVKHGLVRRVADWRWSSFHTFVRAGLLPMDWATEVTAAKGFGE
jgi:putative transposase